MQIRIGEFVRKETHGAWVLVCSSALEAYQAALYNDVPLSLRFSLRRPQTGTSQCGDVRRVLRHV